MTTEIDALVETYTILKEYVPAKERQTAADALMSVMVDMLSDQELQELAGVDKYLRNSLDEYSQDVDDEDADNYDYEE